MAQVLSHGSGSVAWLSLSHGSGFVSWLGFSWLRLCLMAQVLWLRLRSNLVALGTNTVPSVSPNRYWSVWMLIDTVAYWLTTRRTLSRLQSPRLVPHSIPPLLQPYSRGFLNYLCFVDIGHSCSLRFCISPPSCHGFVVAYNFWIPCSFSIFNIILLIFASNPCFYLICFSHLCFWFLFQVVDVLLKSLGPQAS